MLAHALDDVLYGERIALHLYRVLDDALCQLHVDAAVVNHAVCHE